MRDELIRDLMLLHYFDLPRTTNESGLDMDWAQHNDHLLVKGITLINIFIMVPDSVRNIMQQVSILSSKKLSSQKQEHSISKTAAFVLCSRSALFDCEHLSKVVQGSVSWTAKEH